MRPWSMPCPPDNAIAEWLSARETVTAAAALWAERLQLPVSVEATPCPSNGLPPSPLDATVGWMRGPEVGFIQVPCALVADRLSELAGSPARSPRSLQRGLPAPLTPAEDGLLAWLALGWLGAWPEPKPALAWLAGPLDPFPALRALDGAVLWRVQVGDAPPGLVRWHVGRSDAASASSVLHPIEVYAYLDPRISAERLDAALPGEALLLDSQRGPLSLVLPDGSRWRARLEGDALLAFEDDAQAPEPAVGWVLRLNPIDLSASSMSGLITRAPIRLACPLTGGLPAGGHGGLVASVAQANVLVVFGAT